jgi:hypothetical protein
MRQDMSEQTQHNIERLTNSIHSHRSSLDAIAQRLRTPEVIAAFNKWDHNSWCISVAGDALVRLRLFTEQNFNFVETMGIISVARYIFELSVWLYLFKLNARYGLVYFNQLIDTQKRYYKSMKEQLEREVILLNSFETREKESEERELEGFNALTATDRQKEVLLSTFKLLSDAIDVEASRQFSIYAQAAQINGYGYQAYLVQTKAIPQVDQALTQIDLERDRFNATVPQDVKDLIPPRWNWRQMAQLVGLTDEYDYIYSFASKLLHATPASITTDQKNLELEEMQVFLKYIDVKMADLEILAEEYC